MTNYSRFATAVALRGSAICCSFLITILLARALNTAEYGSYIFALSVLTILAIPIQSGLPELIVREASAADGAGDHGRVKGILIRAFQFSLVLPILMMTIWLLIVFAFPQAFDAFPETSLISLAIFALPALALLAVIGAALRAFQVYFAGQVLGLLLSRLLNLVLLVAVVSLPFFGTLTATSAISVYILAAAGTLIVATYVLYKQKGRNWFALKARFETRKWAKGILPLSLIAGLQIIVSKTDIVMLRGLLGPSDVAIYHVASQFGNLVLIAKSGVLMVAGPRMARLYADANMPRMQVELSQAARFVFLSGLPIAVVLILFGRPLLNFAFGPEFSDAYTTMVIIAVGYLALSLFGTIDTLLKMTNRENVVLKSIAIAIVLNIALNAILIPSYGTAGAAVASAVSMLAWRCVVVWQAYRSLGLVSFAISPKP